ncbi:hypothetical protein DVH24_025021 [Malus domestica]|uniref:Uncharacterized protein n=1 Tax=Malus domestica TaxID=3750 RepID=A0A498JKF6_MALDO|nr:hypothetical protein DVH24_025021 [Malus domestica]
MVLTNDRLFFRKCVTPNSFCMCKSAREVRDSDLPTLQLLGSCDLVIWGHIGYLVADTIGQHGKSAGGVGDAWKIWWQTQSCGM